MLIKISLKILFQNLKGSWEFHYHFPPFAKFFMRFWSPTFLGLRFCSKNLSLKPGFLLNRKSRFFKIFLRTRFFLRMRFLRTRFYCITKKVKYTPDLNQFLDFSKVPTPTVQMKVRSTSLFIQEKSNFWFSYGGQRGGLERGFH